MKNSRLIRIIILIIMIVIGGIIINYYWRNDSLDSMVSVPMGILIWTFAYILCQIGKRFFFKKRNWWDWLYYIGLVVIILPRSLATPDNLSSFQLITDMGILFLLIPVLFDGKQLLDENKSGTKNN
ncbi:MAG: hypothetical protein KC454_02045 [Flavobacteriales bacterium]|nr:hypothetical protein [Flavobacteriales bacterium]